MSHQPAIFRWDLRFVRNIMKGGGDMKFNYDSYCGLYCGACSILKAYESGDKDEMASFWNDEVGLELKCHGCKSDTVFYNCASCKIRNCATARKVERCMDCKHFPCNLMKAEELKVLLDKLPHLKTIANNLMIIKNNGVEKWLSEQKEQWKCPDCQTHFTWYATYCSKCGKNLVELKSFTGSFDKSIFK